MEMFWVRLLIHLTFLILRNVKCTLTRPVGCDLHRFPPSPLVQVVGTTLFRRYPTTTLSQRIPLNEYVAETLCNESVVSTLRQRTRCINVAATILESSRKRCATKAFFQRCDIVLVVDTLLQRFWNRCGNVEATPHAL